MYSGVQRVGGRQSAGRRIPPGTHAPEIPDCRVKPVHGLHQLVGGRAVGLVSQAQEQCVAGLTLVIRSWIESQLEPHYSVGQRSARGSFVVESETSPGAV